MSSLYPGTCRISAGRGWPLVLSALFTPFLCQVIGFLLQAVGSRSCFSWSRLVKNNTMIIHIVTSSVGDQSDGFLPFTGCYSSYRRSNWEVGNQIGIGRKGESRPQACPSLTPAGAEHPLSTARRTRMLSPWQPHGCLFRTLVPRPERR